MTDPKLRMCINCRFYCKGAHYDCKENVDELVKDKDRPNFCEWFSLDAKAASENEEIRKNKASSAEDAFNNFFSV